MSHDNLLYNVRVVSSKGFLSPHTALDCNDVLHADFTKIPDHILEEESCEPLPDPIFGDCKPEEYVGGSGWMILGV